MDKFLKLADRLKSHATNFIAADRAKQHNQELYEDGGKLFCRTCNVVLMHECKSIVEYTSVEKQGHTTMPLIIFK